MVNLFNQRPNNKLASIPLSCIKITDSFWSGRQKINKDISLPLLLKKLKADHHLDNFRVAARVKSGIHQGDFYYDSDLYKWLEGALYFSKEFPLNDDIKGTIKEIIDLIQKSQLNDGYLNTYYSLNFLEKRFTNLLIFHELYCAGHLIEAAIAERNLNDIKTLFKVAKKFTNLLVEKILKQKIKDTAGHPEIELALIKLYRATGNKEYLNLCKYLIEIRGNIPHLRTYIIRRLLDAIKTFTETGKIKKDYKGKKETTEIEKEEVAEFLEEFNMKDWLIFLKQNLNGKQYQLNIPIRDSYNPVGHAVRALYLYSGIADLYSEIGDESLLHALELLWFKMVKAKIYITGGTGSLRSTEGFDKDFQLKLEDSYSETCAAIANIMWNWRLLLITKKCKYADLIEKLLYNAMLVGQSLDGKKYFYTNPVISDWEHERKEWFKCPCCPTNYIRMIPQLGQYIYSTSKNGIWIHQYIGSELEIPINSRKSVKIKQESQFPWNGKIKIQFFCENNEEFSLYLRIPEWSNNANISLNNEEIKKNVRQNSYLRINRKWSNEDLLKFDFQMQPRLISDEMQRKQTNGKRVIQYGPLIYCLENIDNKDLDISELIIAAEPHLKTKFNSSFLERVAIIKGKTRSGKIFKAIPYFAWCNRGKSKMRVWINADV